LSDRFGDFVTLRRRRATSAVPGNRSLAARSSRWLSDWKWPQPDHAPVSYLVRCTRPCDHPRRSIVGVIADRRL